MKLALAAAITASACLSGPVAAAAPPDCQSYKFTGMGKIVEDDGPDLFTGWAPDGRSGAVNTFDGYTAYGHPERSVPAGTSMNGSVKGGIDGRNVQFTVTWDDAGGLTGTADTFYGQVYSATDVRGQMARAQTQWATGTWHWEGDVKCVDPAASANTGPKQANVVAATDIYDKPDGVGQKIGSLVPGTSFPIMEPCHDDWCRIGGIELGGYEGLPNGTAWVYTKDYITFS